MNIDLPCVKKELTTETTKTVDNKIKLEKISSTSSNKNTVDPETKMALDNATGLLQSIVTDKISEKVIRKMPSDEYLHLLSLLDEIISGSIDKHV